MKIYHQLGWRYQWNFQSLKNDGTGDGVILAPRFLDYEFVTTKIEQELKEKSIFDPQFFIPSYAKGKLISYNFFPDIFADGFSTEDFSADIAQQAAKNCINFQVENNFEIIIIPSRFYSGNPEKFMDLQTTAFVEPYLKEIGNIPKGKKVYLQLVLEDTLIKDPTYSAKILNWVTSLQEIDGVYLIYQATRRSKQIKDIDFLYSLLHFIYALKDLNYLDVLIGYTNVELLLLSIADPNGVTIGSYETTRMFDIRKFEQDDEKRILSQPSPRVYMSKLMQMVDYRYINSIEEEVKNGNYIDLLDRNSYEAEMFEETFKWNFQKPQLYKHYFLEITKQLKRISHKQGKERYNLFVDMANEALRHYDFLDKRGVILDPNSDGSHISAWLTAANRFANDRNWR